MDGVHCKREEYEKMKVFTYSEYINGKTNFFILPVFSIGFSFRNNIYDKRISFIYISIGWLNKQITAMIYV